MRPVLFTLSLLAGACRLPNPDHCVHKDVQSDAWCAAQDPERPYCSPCVEEEHGCVAAEPDPEACPAYAPDTTTADATSADTPASSSTG